jgi:hypothetical protein
MDLVQRIGWSLLWSGVFLVLAALVSEWSGTRARIGGHVVNTHVTATFVLGSLGLVLVANAFVVFAATTQKKGVEDPGES